jgi:hypothetical protein
MATRFTARIHGVLFTDGGCYSSPLRPTCIYIGFSRDVMPSGRNSTSTPPSTPKSLRSSPIPQSISPLPTMSAARAFSTALRAGVPRAPIARFAATRGYAAAAPASTKPPVALFGVDGTYASALVRLLLLPLALVRWRGDGNARNRCEES